MNTWTENPVPLRPVSYRLRWRRPAGCVFIHLNSSNLGNVMIVTAVAVVLSGKKKKKMKRHCWLLLISHIFHYASNISAIIIASSRPCWELLWLEMKWTTLLTPFVEKVEFVLESRIPAPVILPWRMSFFVFNWSALCLLCVWWRASKHMVTALCTVTFSTEVVDGHVLRDGGCRARLSEGRLTTTAPLAHSLALSAGSSHVSWWHGSSSVAAGGRPVFGSSPSSLLLPRMAHEQPDRERSVCITCFSSFSHESAGRRSDKVRRFWMWTWCSHSGAFLRSVMEERGRLKLGTVFWYLHFFFVMMIYKRWDNLL